MSHLISKPEHPPRRWSQLQRLTGVGSSTQTVAAVPQRSPRSWRVSNGLWLYGLAGAAQVGRQPDDRLVDATQQPGHAEQGGPTVGLGDAGAVGLRCVDVLLGPGPSTTRGFGAAPDPLAPPHPHRRAERQGVVQAWTCRPWSTATTLQSGQPVRSASDSTSSTTRPCPPPTSGSRVTSRTCMPSTPNNASLRAHHDAPGPHVQ
jgi:hypothetical protein